MTALLVVAAAAAGAGGALRVMPLGDSITQGYHDSYRNPLWFALEEAGWNVDFVGSMNRTYGGREPPRKYDGDHEGHWGWQADEVLGRVGEWAERANPDVVLLHIGTNDVGRGQAPREVAGEVEQIIARLREHNPDIHVLLAQIIPVGHPAANERIRQYNEALSTTAAALDRASSRIILIDQHSGFDEKQDTYDGIHPNESGNLKMAARWLAGMEQLNLR